MLFHVGVLVVFFGHLVGLLTPIWVFDALGISHGAKQWLAIVLGGVAGAMAIVGATLLGLATIPISLQHLDGSEMVTFMSWAQGIFTFDPAASSYILDAHPIFKAHLLLGLTIFLIFPFTRLVHMLSAPVRYIWRPGYQVVRARTPRPSASRIPAE